MQVLYVCVRGCVQPAFLTGCEQIYQLFNGFRSVRFPSLYCCRFVIKEDFRVFIQVVSCGSCPYCPSRRCLAAAGSAIRAGSRNRCPSKYASWRHNGPCRIRRVKCRCRPGSIKRGKSSTRDC